MPMMMYCHWITRTTRRQRVMQAITFTFTIRKQFNINVKLQIIKIIHFAS